ncbi:MAG: HAMP domain-containing sensor histidine kinase [Eubacteriales bacterium]|nr:HAMP domain-containing sensor histidine kinase [Eubacteriales bacterium]
MSGLSIKQRVTLFYASVMLLFILLVMTVLYVTLDIQLTHVSHQVLERSVKDAFDDIDMPGDWLEIPNDFDFFINDVTLLIYGQEGTKVIGHAPQDFPEGIALRSDTHQRFTSERESWQVYDLYTEYPNETGLWVRGVYSLSNSKQTLRNVLLIMLFALPVLVAIALVAGYLVTKRAFAPVSQIQKTAEQIIKNKDLSRRIGLRGNKRDEIYSLATTYDQLLDRIETAFEQEKQFTSDVSHELRTPVSVVISQAEYALSQNDPEIMRKSLGSVLRQSEHMSLLIAQLLDLSRTGHALQSMKYERFNLAELCDMVVDEHQENANNKNIQFIKKLDHRIEINADQTQIMRALINLISNSISYGKENGFIMVDLHSTENRIILSITDDGVGIAPEHLEHIFNRFDQADEARTKGRLSNTGLGLTMVKQIIEAHGGEITVQSTLAVGSTFTISLPKSSEQES